MNLVTNDPEKIKARNLEKLKAGGANVLIRQGRQSDWMHARKDEQGVYRDMRGIRIFPPTESKAATPEEIAEYYTANHMAVY